MVGAVNSKPQRKETSSEAGGDDNATRRTNSGTDWSERRRQSHALKRRRKCCRLVCLGTTFLALLACLQFHRLLVTITGKGAIARDARESQGSFEHLGTENATVEQDGEPSGGEKTLYDILMRTRREMDQAKIHNHTCHSNLNDFPGNFFDKLTTMRGGWVLNLLIAIYVFGCIAQVCDDYFVPSLEHFCEDLGLTPDVAGATFMAAGSSAPELCTSVIGLFVARSNVGVGAIAGSSLFNILVIVGAVGVLAGMPLHITWYPVTRDVIFYMLSVAIMIKTLYDGEVLLYESCLMLLLYLVYIFFMVINKRIRKFIDSTTVSKALLTKNKEVMRKRSTVMALNMEARSRSRIATTYVDPIRLRSVEDELRTLETIDHDHKAMTVIALRHASSSRLTITEPKPVVHKKHVTKGPTPPLPLPPASEDKHVNFESSADGLRPTQSATTSASSSKPSSGHSDDDIPGQKAISVDEYENPLEMPEGRMARICFFIYYPFTFLHAYTIPDSRIMNSWQSKVYVLTFVLAVAYICLYSYIMVWMALHAGAGMQIPDTVIGLTVLAAGTSVPDMMSSIYIARDGYGDMAVSNAIGSNIFDILVGLGVPWIISSATDHDPGDDHDEAIFYTATILFGTSLLVWTVLLLNHWTLDMRGGIFFLVLYLVTIGICILMEMGVLVEKGKC